MDKQFYATVTNIVEQTLTDRGFNLVSDNGPEYYSDGGRAFKIDYDEASKQIRLQVAALKEGEGVAFKVVSAWLLDESSDERDMTSIGNDFSDTVLEQIGVKASAQGMNKIDIPTKDKHAETVNVENFTGRFLAVYPAYKDAYKENVAKYGEFLYDEFYRTFGPEIFTSVVKEGNKKGVTKLFELLNSCYVSGDKTVSALIVFDIITPAVMADEKIKKDAYTYMEKYTYLYQATVSMVALLSKKSAKKKYGIE